METWDELFAKERKRWEPFIRCDLSLLSDAERADYDEALRGRNQAEVDGDEAKWRRCNSVMFGIATDQRKRFPRRTEVLKDQIVSPNGISSPKELSQAQTNSPPDKKPEHQRESQPVRGKAVKYEKGACQVANKLFHDGLTEADLTNFEIPKWDLYTRLQRQAAEAGDTKTEAYYTDKLVQMIEVAKERKTTKKKGANQ